MRRAEVARCEYSEYPGANRPQNEQYTHESACAFALQCTQRAVLCCAVLCCALRWYTIHTYRIAHACPSVAVPVRTHVENERNEALLELCCRCRCGCDSSACNGGLFGLRLPYVENEIRVLELVLEFLLRNLLVVPQRLYISTAYPTTLPVAYTHWRSTSRIAAYRRRRFGFGLALQSSL
jgi:hypothetical protein